jgi:hypothetical protein
MLKRIDALELKLKETKSKRKCTLDLLESIADRIAIDFQKGPSQKQKPHDDNGRVLPFSVS